MEITQELINLVKQFEGLRLQSYKDSKGVWTIGYGHTKGVKQGQTITLQEAENLLIDDLEIYGDAVREYVTEAININMFTALTSFTYNVGINAFKNSTLLKELNKGNYNQAKSEFLKWNKSGGQVLNGLTNRRQIESDLFMTGFGVLEMWIPLKSVIIRKGKNILFPLIFLAIILMFFAK